MVMTLDIGAKLKDFGALVKFSHTIFLFPFALSAMLLGQEVKPLSFSTVFWIVVALVSARSAAMVMNRIADLKYDAANPRTAVRPMVTGQVSKPAAWTYLAVACGLFLLAAAMLSPLCLTLSPLVLAWLLGYSYTKRFTELCHIWLGTATALAPMGAWLAVTGIWDWRVVVLCLAVALWVAGFDVIYACQDIDFDQSQGLKSIPARLGLKRALWVSRLMHLGAVLGFGTMAPLFGLGAPYWVGVVLLATVLVVEQVMAAYRKANLPLAFLTLNGVISIIFFMCLVADRLAA
jgi:4-hydroxybenzoate polyprenyltransferase